MSVNDLIAGLNSLTLDATCHPIKFYPTPGDEDFSAHSSGKEKHFYIVSKGIQPGIYTRWPPANAQVTGIKGATECMVNTYDEAVDQWNAKQDTCQCPDTSKNSVRILKCSDSDLEDTCDPEESFFPAPGDEDIRAHESVKKNRFYVVWKGRKPGIYTQWTSEPMNPDVSAYSQTDKVANSHQKVKTWDEAANVWRHTCFLTHESPCRIGGRDGSV